jgi:cation diffusion facilitator CzcD-associated flavoprotein CzcO
MGQPMRAIVAGAGLGGLAAAVKLKEVGIAQLTILEAADRVGGVWRQNTYPGCACDVPVALYSFTFAPAMHWTRRFPPAQEIQHYCELVTDQFGLREALRVNTGAHKATWHANQNVWRVETAAGDTIEAEILVAALGQLNRPAWPDIPGLSDFSGPRMHAADWDHGVTLAGRRIGVVGAAASAVQLIPEVAKIAGHLSVFQRTPNYLLPRQDLPVTDADKALMMSAPEMAMRLAAAQREAIFDNADAFFWQAFAWTPEGREAYALQARLHLESQVDDPDLRRKLTPDYPIGCKRILFCDDYYPTLQRANVSLVTDAIDRITPDGIGSRDGALHAIDVLICATGFETTGWKWSLDIVGENGNTLADAWSNGPEAHLGMMAAGFPNLFFMYGPHTNLGHNSIIAMLEAQAGFVGRAAAAMQARGLRTLAPSKAGQGRFIEALEAKLAKTVWADPACASWYKNAAGRITQNWSGTVGDYERAVAHVDWADYETS